MTNEPNKLEGTLKLIEVGIKQLTSSEEWKRYLEFQSKFHDYSFGNTMLILAQCPNASRVAGYQTWKQLGRQVRKGEKSIGIIAPMMIKKDVEDENGNSEVKKILRFRGVSVFDISQTDGDPLPQLVTELQGETELYENVKSVIPYPLKELEDCGGANGYYHLVEKYIAVLSTNSQAQKTETLIHEWAHGILHGNINDEKDRPNKMVRELEADSVAFIVCHHLGLDTSDYSFGYLAGWGQGEKAVEEIKKSGERIQKASQEILTALETKSKELDKTA